MTSGILSRDQNFIPVIGGVSSLDDKTVRSFQYDPTTRGLLVQLAGDDAGLATSDNQTNGTQKTQIVDQTGVADPFSGYGKYDVLTTDATYYYKCFQNASDAWIIIRIRKATSYTTTYAKGTSGTAAAWAAYSSQTFQDYATTF